MKQCFMLVMVAQQGLETAKRLATERWMHPKRRRISV